MTLLYLVAAFALSPFLMAHTANTSAKIVCAYDSKAFYRQDSGKFLVADLEHSLSHCTHIIYLAAKIDPVENKIKARDPELDADSGQQNYKAVTALKKRFPGLQILLAVGNWYDDEDEDKSEKYLTLLRDPNTRGTFISSVHSYVKKYGFDGIDMAWQFPLLRVQKRSSWGSFWHKVKKTVGAAKGSKDEKADEHRAGWTALVKQMKLTMRPDGYLVTASVIPHTNFTLYWDPREVAPYLDAIHLQTFDYITPEKKITPEVADYPAPLYSTYDRNPNFNVDATVRWFLDNGAPPNKLILGIPTYGRTWKLTSDSAASGVPPIEADGEGAEGHLTHQRGILSYPEICTLLQNPNNHGTKGLLKYVNDPSKKSGVYAYRQEDSEREGIWTGYEDLNTVRWKAEYARNKNLAGVVFYDLSLEDFRGVCHGDRFPLIKAAKAAFY